MNSIKIFTRSNLLACFFIISLLGCQKSIEPQIDPKSTTSNGLNDGKTVNSASNPSSVPNPSTVRYIFEIHQSRAIKTTGVGNENLVNNTKSANTLLSEMANASDVNNYQPYTPATGTTSEVPGLLRDTAGNTWTLYTPSPSTREAFRVKGYAVVRSIDWGSGPDQPVSPNPQKLRFTIE